MSRTGEKFTNEVGRTPPGAARLNASLADFLTERPDGADEDVHMLSKAVDHVIETYTEPGDTVLDPFAGFGTTLARAAALGRHAAGVELLPERADYVRHRVPAARVFEGDARELQRILQRAAPPVTEASVDLILTSPPYMTRNEHEPDPLTAYVENNGDYDRYLAELSLVAAQCARAVKPGGHVVWNVADIHYRGFTTDLISDCARVLDRHLELVGVTEIAWDQYPHDLTADALLVFRRAA